ncbi:TAXI family TRAP transporter solute-binding subunit [Streptomyces sp. NPDC046716]|uniref:TAXI family TRAP transporter solute-binding subunit n=1 Tax=Streptomyces sp. NPDC046716 TaxID=3157093 RepID=UPI0033F47BFB
MRTGLNVSPYSRPHTAMTGDISGIGRGPSGVLRLATGEPTAFYEAFGHLLADELPAAHPGPQCHVHTTAGSVDNIERLRDGRADLALVLTSTAQDATGTDVFPRPGPLWAVGRVYENHLQFAVRADTGVRAVAGLRGGHVDSLGAPGSRAAVFGERLLRAAGLSAGTDVHVRHLPLNDAASAMAAVFVDGLLVAGGVPLPMLKNCWSGAPRPSSRTTLWVPSSSASAA